MKRNHWFLAILLCGGCAQVTAPDLVVEESTSLSSAVGDGGTSRYADVEQYLIDSGDDAGFDAWRGLVGTLRANFDDVCGDTFCEGDYSDLEPLRLACTVAPATGVMKSCKYVFAGSYANLDDRTGSIRVTARTYSCALPVAGIALSSFLTTMTAAAATPPLRRSLPKAAVSIYDALGNCL